MHASTCYHACMANKTRQYTVRIDDLGLDKAVRSMAKKQGKSINQTILDILYKSTNYSKKSSWAQYSGIIPYQPVIESVLRAQRSVDSKDWQ